VGPPRSCALLEVDLLSESALRPEPSPLEGQIDGGTIRIFGTHSLNLRYGALVRVVVERVLKASTGHSTIQGAIESGVDCLAINDWVLDVTRILLGPSGNLVDGLDLKPSCQSAVTAVTTAVVSGIEGLNAELPLKLGGDVTIERPTDSNIAEGLTQGAWDLYVNGNPTQRVGGWNAERP